jgi:prepilin-type N-terminal cleavage/methylation domain-containing protein
MTLNNIKTLKKERGFTIVELLIVIVVIAILAAIVIVAYNGIQNRAKTQSAQSAAANMQKKIEAYNAATGSYPLGAASASAFNALLNGQTESSLGTLAAGTPSTTNYATTVQVEYCNTGATGIRLGWYDFSASAVVATGSRIVILATGTTCSAWASSPLS